MDHKEFLKKFNEAGDDPEKLNELLTERTQMYIDKILSCVNHNPAGDAPFILAALEVVNTAVRDKSDPTGKFLAETLLEGTQYAYTKKEHIKEE